jgi:hypothetical protein
MRLFTRTKREFVKQFHYFSTVYFKNNSDKDGVLQLVSAYNELFLLICSLKTFVNF